jgi:hypothetical protein
MTAGIHHLVVALDKRIVGVLSDRMPEAPAHRCEPGRPSAIS